MYFNFFKTYQSLKYWKYTCDIFKNIIKKYNQWIDLIPFNRNYKNNIQKSQYTLFETRYYSFLNLLFIFNLKNILN